MRVNIKGLDFSVEEHQIEQFLLKNLNGGHAQVIASTHVPPAIGDSWRALGGVYAGVARGRDGAPDYYLIAGPEHEADIGWQSAMDWAGKIESHSFSDFALPHRKEQALLFANVPELFKPEWYWSCEPHASYSGNAWLQDFVSGSQHYNNKTFLSRARVVRRLIIQ